VEILRRVGLRSHQLSFTQSICPNDFVSYIGTGRVVGLPIRSVSTPSMNRSKSKTSDRKPRSKWSGRVTTIGDAMDLKLGVFESKKPKDIARSVKRSSETSNRRKGNPYRSALSMISFYETRGGKNLSRGKKDSTTREDRIEQEL
jgi:hypothetical protein